MNYVKSGVFWQPNKLSVKKRPKSWEALTTLASPLLKENNGRERAT